MVRVVRHLALVGAAVYTALVVTLLWSPPTGAEPLFPHDDKVFHAAAFAGLGMSWWWAVQRWRLVLAVGAALAVVTEVVQALLPWPRSMDPWDMAADVAGLAVGIVVARRLRPLADSAASAMKKEKALRVERLGRSRRDSNPR